MSSEGIRRAVAVLSGGLDSSVAMALAMESKVSVELAVTFDYGQRASEREIESAAMIARYFGAKHTSITLPWFKEFRTCGALMSDSVVLPTPRVAQLDDQSYTSLSAEAVWVPNRNGVLIEVGASLAEDRAADGVIVGFNCEEAVTFPDNSAAYMRAMTRALSFSTSNGVRVISPTALFNKKEIVREGVRLKFPWEFLWSCYGNHEKMCGRCESCMRLKRAFNANEVPFNGYFENARF